MPVSFLQIKQQVSKMGECAVAVDASLREQQAIAQTLLADLTHSPLSIP